MKWFSRARGSSRLAASFPAIVAKHSKIAAIGVVLVVYTGWTTSTQARLLSAAPTPIASPTTPSTSTPFTGAPDVLASIPLFKRLSAEGTGLRSYSVPVSLAISVHKFIFTFHFARTGAVHFAQPDTLSAAISSVPKKYTDVLGELGTARTWPLIYDLAFLGVDSSKGQPTYRLRGVPRQLSDVEYVLIATTDANAPISAQWVLRSGWTITEMIDMESVGTYLLPKRESADIVGNGFKIHSDMTYGDYILNDDDNKIL